MRDVLARAVIEHAFADQVEPVLQPVLREEEDALTGLVTALEAVMTMISQHRNALAAAKQPAQFPVDVVAPLFERLAIVLARAQQQGTVRADLRTEDLPRLLIMVFNTMWLNDTPRQLAPLSHAPARRAPARRRETPTPGDPGDPGAPLYPLTPPYGDDPTMTR